MKLISVLKYTLGAPITLPYLAWQYGWSKITPSYRSYDFASDRNYWRYWFCLLCLCLGAISLVLSGNMLGSALCNSIFPGGGVASSVITVLIDLWSLYVGACFGLGGGAVIAKLSVKLWWGGEYRFKQLPRGYNRNKLPPVRYSNHAKYWVDYHYQPNAQGLYERDGNTYSRKDLWKIFYFLYCQKSKNKKELSILAQISPSNANEKDEEIIAENKAFNAALEKVRNLKLVEEKPEEQKPVEARKMSKWHRFLQALSMGSSEKKPQEEQKPVEAGDTRKWYKLQVGAFFYSLEGSDAKETLEEMRSPTFIITKGAELKA